MLTWVGVLAVLSQSFPARAEPRPALPASSRPAQAADARLGFELAWQAPAGCPQREVIYERIRALLGASADKAIGVRARGKIARRNGRYRLTLTVDRGGSAGERAIESDSCGDLAGAAAVALVLLIGVEVESPATTEGKGATGGHAAAPSTEVPTSPDAATSAKSRASADQQTAATPATPSPASPKQPSPPHEQPFPSSPEVAAPAAGEEVSTSWRAVLLAPLLGVDLGPLPVPRPTLGFAFGLRGRPWQFTLGARLSLGQTVHSSGTPAYTAELGRSTAELRGCYAVHWKQFDVAPCLLATLDRLTARGAGQGVSSQTRHAAVFAAGAGAVARWEALRSVALIVSLGAQLQASRPHIVIDGVGEIDQLAPFAVTVSAGPEWSL